MSPGQFEAVIQAIDERNKQDPHQDTSTGKSLPHELLYSEHLTRWVLKLKPEASELLRIVARGQHIQRWTIPRDRYPMDRGGYLRWREDLKKFHAATVGEIMTKAGYSQEETERVSVIILKKNLKTDPDVQVIEDALCLVFLETQFSDLRAKTEDAKMIDIVKKTWKKMSSEAQSAALALDLPREEMGFLKRALAK